MSGTDNVEQIFSGVARGRSGTATLEESAALFDTRGLSLVVVVEKSAAAVLVGATWLNPVVDVSDVAAEVVLRPRGQMNPKATPTPHDLRLLVPFRHRRQPSTSALVDAR